MKIADKDQGYLFAKSQPSTDELRSEENLIDDSGYEDLMEQEEELYEFDDNDDKTVNDYIKDPYTRFWYSLLLERI